MTPTVPGNFPGVGVGQARQDTREIALGIFLDLHFDLYLILGSSRKRDRSLILTKCSAIWLTFDHLRIFCGSRNPNQHRHQRKTISRIQGSSMLSRHPALVHTTPDLQVGWPLLRIARRFSLLLMARFTQIPSLRFCYCSWFTVFCFDFHFRFSALLGGQPESIHTPETPLPARTTLQRPCYVAPPHPLELFFPFSPPVCCTTLSPFSLSYLIAR